MTNQFATIRIEHKHLQCIILELCGQGDTQQRENRYAAAEWMITNGIINKDCFSPIEVSESVAWGNGLNRLDTMQSALLLTHILNGKGNPVITRVLDVD